jgi:hypothetical protein
MARKHGNSANPQNLFAEQQGAQRSLFGAMYLYEKHIGDLNFDRPMNLSPDQGEKHRVPSVAHTAQ